MKKQAASAPSIVACGGRFLVIQAELEIFGEGATPDEAYQAYVQQLAATSPQVPEHPLLAQARWRHWRRWGFAVLVGLALLYGQMALVLSAGYRLLTDFPVVVEQIAAFIDQQPPEKKLAWRQSLRHLQESLGSGADAGGGNRPSKP